MSKWTQRLGDTITEAVIGVEWSGILHVRQSSHPGNWSALLIYRFQGDKLPSYQLFSRQDDYEQFADELDGQPSLNAPIRGLGASDFGFRFNRP